MFTSDPRAATAVDNPANRPLPPAFQAHVNARRAAAASSLATPTSPAERRKLKKQRKFKGFKKLKDLKGLKGSASDSRVTTRDARDSPGAGSRDSPIICDDDDELAVDSEPPATASGASGRKRKARPAAEPSRSSKRIRQSDPRVQPATVVDRQYSPEMDDWDAEDSTEDRLQDASESGPPRDYDIPTSTLLQLLADRDSSELDDTSTASPEDPAPVVAQQTVVESAAAPQGDAVDPPADVVDDGGADSQASPGRLERRRVATALLENDGDFEYDFQIPRPVAGGQRRDICRRCHRSTVTRWLKDPFAWELSLNCVAIPGNRVCAFCRRGNKHCFRVSSRPVREYLSLTYRVYRCSI